MPLPPAGVPFQEPPPARPWVWLSRLSDQEGRGWKPRTYMDFKRILRTPMVWVVLIVGIGVLLLSLQGAGGFTRIDTSAAE